MVSKGMQAVPILETVHLYRKTLDVILCLSNNIYFIGLEMVLELQYLFAGIKIL